MSRRQKIIELLEDTETPLSPAEISRILKIDKKDVIRDLDHVRYSVKRKGKKMIIIPQRCKKCGFVFEPTTHVATKCPVCKSQWLEEPKFRIVDQSRK